MKLSTLGNSLIASISLCSLLTTGSVSAMPAAAGGSAADMPPVLLTDLGNGDGSRLLLAIDANDKQVYATGTPSAKGYYLVPKTAQITVSRDRADEKRADITIPIMAGLQDDGDAQAATPLPPAVAALPLWYLGGRMNLAISTALRDRLQEIASNDPGAQITFTDYSGFPMDVRVQIQELKSFNPLPMQTAFKSALKVNKPFFIRLIHSAGRVSDDELSAIVTGMTIEIAQVTTSLKKTDWEFELPDPQSGLVNLGEGGKREIPFYQAFDALDSSLPNLLKASSPELFTKMSALLRETDWRMNLLQQAYQHYFSGNGAELRGSAPVCGPYRVRARSTAGAGSFVQTVYLPEMGQLTIQLKPWMQQEG